ncbi:BgTH12-07504 [Blumeria graminis f. sp. triticale]|uniref:BgTH12-07504 n=1 Tax=Blumeria graminis f. sp. triticale TaxID=1689686 RepID=A0A9W4CXJ1_BLUGR|nr:BgTH12-07504 [Blumeria graminis f. sp. triticale]
MRITKFGRLQVIVYTAVISLELALQCNASGYICDDHIVMHEEAQEVALYASKLLNPVDPKYKYPALLEDNQLFGIENRNIFVVPFKNDISIRNGGKPGSDRVVIDDEGNFLGVMMIVDNEAGAVPTYKKCTKFLTYNELSLNLNVDDIYQNSGFACGSNFLSAEIETKMKTKCRGLENLSPTNKEFFQFLCRQGINWSDNKFWFKHVIEKDYNIHGTKQAAVYRVEFSSTCRLIQIKPAVRNASIKPACIEVWTMKPSVGITSINPSMNIKNQNQESSETYLCNNVTFRMVNLRNYLSRIHSLQGTAPATNTEGVLIRQNGNLILWPIFSPEKRKKRSGLNTLFAMGFDNENNFSGLYYISAKNKGGTGYKECPREDWLRSSLVKMISTENDGRTRIFFS